MKDLIKTGQKIAEHKATIEALIEALERVNEEVFPCVENSAEPYRLERQAALVDAALGLTPNKDIAQLDALIAKAEAADTEKNRETKAAKQRNIDQIAGIQARIDLFREQLSALEVESIELQKTFLKQQANEAANEYAAHAAKAVQAFAKVQAADSLILSMTDWKETSKVVATINHAIRLPGVVGVDPIPSKSGFRDGYMLDCSRGTLLIDDDVASLKSDIKLMLAG